MQTITPTVSLEFWPKDDKYHTLLQQNYQYQTNNEHCTMSKFMRQLLTFVSAALAALYAYNTIQRWILSCSLTLWPAAPISASPDQSVATVQPATPTGRCHRNAPSIPLSNEMSNTWNAMSTMVCRYTDTHSSVSSIILPKQPKEDASLDYR